MNPALGQLVLAVHIVVIAFNVAGLVLIPLGARLGWRFVRLRWLRLLHIGSLAVVAFQALLGRACFLTDWQATLDGGAAEAPLIMRWVNSAIFWPLPMVGVHGGLCGCVRLCRRALVVGSARKAHSRLNEARLGGTRWRFVDFGMRLRA